jgi:2-keto-3-deoxy-L-rhamnonate aldolase RhmA
MKIASFKERLTRGELIVGTWLKTPSYIVAEVLAGSDLDVLCLDAEHAPFDRGDLDAAVLACRANDMPVLIRAPSAAPETILNALDIGAAGVVVPHVVDERSAKSIAHSCHYGPGGRGYAGSSRAAGYTRTKMPQHLGASRASTVVVAQIEDAEGVDNIEAIAREPRIDCLFIGRADLAVSYGAASASDPTVIAAAERVCAAGARAGRAVGMFVPDLAEIPRWRTLGVSLYLLESDHTFLLRGAAALGAAVRAAIP